MVAPAVVVLLVLGVSNPIVVGAALIYAGARVGFTLAYWAGVNKVRSFFWGLGMAMIAVLTIQAMLAAASNLA